MGLLNSVFRIIDPVIDFVDPAHNYIQEWTTGSKDTKGQSPYFEALFPMIIDQFWPGVGSAIGAVDKGSNGNWTGAGISAIGALSQSGALSDIGTAATAADAANTANTANDVSNASTAVNAADDVAAAGSTASNASGYTSGYDSFSSIPDADASGVYAMNASSGVDEAALNSTYATGDHGYGNFNVVKNEATAGQPGYGWKYQDNGYAVSPDGKIYSMGEQVTGAGGQEMGLLDYAGVYADKANRFVNSKNVQNSLKIGAAGMATDQRLRAQQAMKNQQMMPRPVEAPEWGAQSGRQVRSFQELSPYQNFNGGFNPRRMSRSGLLG